MVLIVPWLWVTAVRAAPPPTLTQVWVEVDRPGDRERIAALRHAALGESSRVRGGRAQVRVVVGAGGLDELARAGLKVVEPAESTPVEGYHSPDDGTSWLEDLAAGTNRAGIVRYGTSVDGAPIEAMWVGKPPGSGAPSYRILAAHHGDEPSSAEVALALAERLVSEGDPDVDSILNRSTVWIVPYVNPDGVEAGTRENARGVDLNRNYDYQWAEDTLAPGEEPFSEPETRAVRDAVAFERPVASLTLHSGATNIGWPWNYTTDTPEDDSTLRALGTRYASACHQPGFWLTQGSDWYISHGDTNDWSYGRYGGFDLTVEVSEVEQADALPDVVRWHVEAILAFLSIEPGVHGAVVDATSGAPVEALLTIDDGGRSFYADAATGAFARILPPGGGSSVAIRAEAPGYEPHEVQVSGSTSVKIELQPESLLGERAQPVALWTRAAPRFPGGGAVTLVKPGEDPVAVEPGEELDPAKLAPGAWTIELADGGVIPRGLLVEDHGSASVERWVDEDGRVEIDGKGFGAGARAWALAGLERAPVEVPIAVESATEMKIEDRDLPDDDPVDLVLWTDGSLLALADLRAGGARESLASEDLRAVGGCGCDGFLASRGAGALSILLAALAAGSRRRS